LQVLLEVIGLLTNPLLVVGSRRLLAAAPWARFGHGHHKVGAGLCACPESGPCACPIEE